MQKLTTLHRGPGYPIFVAPRGSWNHTMQILSMALLFTKVLKMSPQPGPMRKVALVSVSQNDRRGSAWAGRVLMSRSILIAANA